MGFGDRPIWLCVAKHPVGSRKSTVVSSWTHFDCQNSYWASTAKLHYRLWVLETNRGPQYSQQPKGDWNWAAEMGCYAKTGSSHLGSGVGIWCLMWVVFHLPRGKGRNQNEAFETLCFLKKSKKSGRHLSFGKSAHRIDSLPFAESSNFHRSRLSQMETRFHFTNSECEVNHSQSRSPFDIIQRRGQHPSIYALPGD